MFVFLAKDLARLTLPLSFSRMQDRIPLVGAITAVASTLLRVINRMITSAITNIFRIRCRTIGKSRACNWGPNSHHGRVGNHHHPIRTPSCCKPRHQKCYYQWILEKVQNNWDNGGCSRGQTSHHHRRCNHHHLNRTRVVWLAMTSTITNIFWNRHRTIGIMELTAGAEMATL